MKRIDSHQHFWQLSRGDYSWLTPELALLYKDFLPNDLLPLLQKANATKTVLVQAAATTEETEFMLQIASETEFVAGVVGWVDMESPDVIEQLIRFNENKYFKGIRPMIQDIADINWMLKPEFSAVYEYLIENNLTFDALVTPNHLEALHSLLLRYPRLKVVIDHGAKPCIANNSSHHWFENIALIASETSACCKLSGLVTEAGPNPSYSTLHPYMEHLLVNFTASRLMWGSDWPVVNLSSNYSLWAKDVETFIEPLTTKEQQSIWSNTAEKFYGLQ